MRTTLIIFLSSFITLFTFAQDKDTVAAVSKGVSITESPKVAELLSKYSEYNEKKEFEDGYRIQIAYTDIRNDIYKSKGAMYKDFPDLPSYVEYEEPYYKLRIGDFKTRLEATHYLQNVVLLYSGAFIVKDKIKVKQ